MKLHELSNTVSRPARKRVGRGNGNNWGRTCGRGDKGQMSRSGAKRRPHFEGGQIPFFRRLPKRGFNHPSHKVYAIINVAALNDTFESGEVVDVESLGRRGMLGNLHSGLKILGDGDVNKPLTVRAHRFSAAAKAKIEEAGGTCEIV